MTLSSLVRRFAPPDFRRKPGAVDWAPSARVPPGSAGAVLALIPSSGLGGGIEAYVEAVLEGIRAAGEEVVRCVLIDATRARPPRRRDKVTFVLRAIRLARQVSGPSPQILAFLPAFTPLALVARLLSGRRRPGITVFFYGLEAWASGGASRWLWRRPHLRRITISSFTAGALATVGHARILRPGVPDAMFRLLTAIEPCRFDVKPMRVLTVFRLADAELKGAFVLLDALEQLRAAGTEVEVTFAGVGPAPESLEAAVDRRTWARIVASPDDSALAALYGEAQIVVLATRLLTRPVPYGEGFGIVLAEAAVAGRLAIGPAFGGSSDALIADVTGLRPTDESVETLADVLGWCASSPDSVERLASNARAWARVQFDPHGYRHDVAGALLGHGGRSDVRLVLSEAPTAPARA